MLAGPLLAAFGWRALWLATGVLSLGYALVVWWVAPVVRRPRASDPGKLAGIGRILRTPGPILLALAFRYYSLQYHALSGLLPTLLVEQIELSVAAAGVLSAITIIANGLGAASARFLLRRGMALWAMIAGGFGFMGAAAFGIFKPDMPAAGVVSMRDSKSLGITGMLAASIYAAAPRFAPQTWLLALTVGIVVQASHLGHVLGPPALATWVESFGWSSAPFLFAAIAAAGITVAFGIRRLSRRDT